MAEYAYNNSVHKTTSVSPFQSLYTEIPKWDKYIQDKNKNKVLTAQNCALNLMTMWRKFKAQVKKAVKAQTKYYNAKLKLQTYNVGDMVYLNSKNITSIWPSKKLNFKFYRPYKVDVSVGKQADHLKLLPSMKIHNIFHVSLLEPGRSRDGTKTVSPPVIVDNNKEYKIEEILDSRHHYGKLQYLVKWLEYPALDNQWVSADNVS